MIGIYKFTYDDTYCYVGQSSNVENRISQHKNDIAKHKHPNMDILGDYDPALVRFEVLKECSAEELNYYEKQFFLRESLKYTMLNRTECGIQGVPNQRLVFYDCEIPSLKYIDNHFEINGESISTLDGMHCISELVSYINNNSNANINFAEKANSTWVVERLAECYKIDLAADGKVIPYLKKLGLYKTVGARANKKTYVEFKTFITLAYTFAPQLSASILRMIVEKL